MVKLSELRSADDIHEQDMRDLDYRREYERTKLANDVAIKVIAYRAKHGLSQASLARQLGMRQPHVARLEAGDHEPSLSTLARLSAVLGLDFSVTVKPDHMSLRYADHGERTRAARRPHERRRPRLRRRADARNPDDSEQVAIAAEGDAPEIVRQAWGTLDRAPDFIQRIWRSDMWNQEQKLALIRSFIDSQNRGDDGGEQELRRA